MKTKNIKLLKSNGNKLEVALKLQVTPCTIDRLILKCKHFAKETFIHENCNRKPQHSMSFLEVATKILKNNLL